MTHEAPARGSAGDAHYFRHRQVAPPDPRSTWLPAYLAARLPADRAAPILDFGCGFGQTLLALRHRGHTHLQGIDIEPDALDFCRAQGLDVRDGRAGALAALEGRFALIWCSHVLEHLPKDQVVPLLRQLRALLAPGGRLMLCVPNAQSSTGSYWAYEDFTHHTLFTSGSLQHVLSQAGFARLGLIDTDCMEGRPWWSRALRRPLLGLYRLRYRFWNWVTASATHGSSPLVFSYELKAMAHD